MSDPAVPPAPRDEARSRAVVTVTPNPSYRASTPFEGWGTSLVWFAHATGAYPDEVREELYARIFGPEGLDLTVARYNVGGGNASDVDDSYIRPGGDVPGWWRADLPGISSTYADRDTYRAAWDADDDASFDLDADPGQRWWLQKLAREGQITRWEAFSNSPPYFMTTSGYATGGFEASTDQLLTESVDQFTGYVLRVVEHLEDAHGIRFHTIDPMNEPNVEYWMTFVDEDGTLSCRGQEGAQLSPALQAAVVESLQRRLARPGTRTTAMISGPDETKPLLWVTDWDGWTPAARDAVGQLNVHTYETEGRTQVRDIAKATGKPLWMSEVDGHFGAGFDPEDVDHGLGMATRIVDDLRELEPSAWVFWQPLEDLYNMEVNDDKGWGSIFIDFDCDADGLSRRRKSDGDPGTPWRIVTNTKFDMSRNFTRYVRPGDVQVATDDTSSVTFVKPDGRSAVVVHVNDTGSAREVVLDLTRFASWSGASVTPVVTTGTCDTTNGHLVLAAQEPELVDELSGKVTVHVPARSVTTLLVEGVSGVAEGAGPPDGIPIVLQNLAHGTVLTTTSGAKAPYAAAPGSAVADEQHWTLTTVAGEGTHRRTVVVRDTAGAALAVDAAGTVALEDPAEGSARQRWILNTLDGHHYGLLNVSSGTQLDAGDDVGAPLTARRSTPSHVQSWRLLAPADTAAL